MTKLMLIAIRNLPDEWLIDNVMIAEFHKNVIATHPERKPITDISRG